MGRDALTRRARILLVDDDADIRSAFGGVLRDAGYHVETAIDGQDGLAQLDGGHDLILLDLLMPFVDGYEFLRRLRLLPQHSRTPVLVVTSHHQGTHLAGAQGVLQKPLEVGTLLRRVSALLDSHG